MCSYVLNYLIFVVCFLQRYLHNHLMNLFAGAWEPRDMSPLPVHIPQATDNQVSLVVNVRQYVNALAIGD